MDRVVVTAALVINSMDNGASMVQLARFPNLKNDLHRDRNVLVFRRSWLSEIMEFSYLD